jgi:hypothetical protein
LEYHAVGKIESSAERLIVTAWSGRTSSFDMQFKDFKIDMQFMDLKKFCHSIEPSFIARNDDHQLLGTCETACRPITIGMHAYIHTYIGLLYRSKAAWLSAGAKRI